MTKIIQWLRVQFLRCKQSTKKKEYVAVNKSPDQITAQIAVPPSHLVQGLSGHQVSKLENVGRGQSVCQS